MSKFCSAFCAFGLTLFSALAAFAGDVGDVHVLGADGAESGMIAAKGFVASAGGRTVLIMTGHAIQQAGGAAGGVILKDFGGREIGRSGRCLVQNSAGGGYTSDLNVYEFSGGSAYSLSSTLPAVGSKVTVHCSEKATGTVEQSSADAVVVSLDHALNALHCSGSPVVDSSGNVVAMLVGTGNGRTSIGCNPAVSILRNIDPRAAASTPSTTSGGNRYGFTPGNTHYLNQTAPTRAGVQTYSAPSPSARVQTYGTRRATTASPTTNKTGKLPPPPSF